MRAALHEPLMGETDFSPWLALRPGLAIEALRVLGITPCERPDLALARSFGRQQAAMAIDLGRDARLWTEVFDYVAQQAVHDGPCGVRIPEQVALQPRELPEATAFVILTAERKLKAWTARFPVIVQVTTQVEAEEAINQGAHGLIIKGQESAGRVGDESSFILLQRVRALAARRQLPLWCQGGMGMHTAAAALAGGAWGVVLDSQLALLNECQLDETIKTDIRAMDGSETRLIQGYSVYVRPGSAAATATSTLTLDEVRTQLLPEAAQPLLPLGQDAALARNLATLWPNAEALLHGMRMRMAGQLAQARELNTLGEESAWAQAHGTRYPIAQGPMTRVSDTAEFAAAVAQAGALPFLALSLSREQSARRLLEQSRALLQGHSWGVGVLGFADPAVLEPQLALIREFKPSVVLLAGGRPSQARALQEQGIPAYLHVPSPGLLELFIKEGARHFIFEGRECGGHVGPRYSFVLWEQQLQVLSRSERVDDMHLLFAGGIHDAYSAAMVAAMTAPLAARGAKIGVLMGSAYILTQEAVSSGAVNTQFQKQILAGGSTVLLETAPGHATRCLQSEYVEQFEAEKKRLQVSGQDAQSIWESLEKLNVGRLRVASKGVRREGDKLVKVAGRGQQAEGMYMIGQLVGLRHRSTTLAQLHQEVSLTSAGVLQSSIPPSLHWKPLEQSRSLHEPVAVIGMACIYPGSPDLESYWSNIVFGRNLVTEVPAERWNSDLYYQEGSAAPGKSPSKWGGFVDETPFDPLAYGIPPQALAAIEPAQLLSLEVARRALLDAGYAAEENTATGKAAGEMVGRRFDREKTAVIFGAESGMDLSNAYVLRNSLPQYLGELPAELDAVLPQLTEDSFPGVLVNVISGRIANRLGLGGVNYSVDAACASSLTAIEVAVKELRSGSSDMVLAGGADFHNSINDYLMFASVKALSATGLCRSFDASADGICLGEGVGVVVLKRLSDARRDGDRVYAVIEGIAGSSDGKGLGLTAPRKEGQKRALERAYWQAGVLPGTVGLIEAHGTGTVVGDRTELQTLTEIFNAGGALPHSAGLGSVKSQIGHTKCAAGIAGFIKVAKALHHRVLPPTLHVQQPNPGYDAHHSPFMLSGLARPWPQTRPRAAVSAFGFGGTNFHAVLAADDLVDQPVRATPASGVAQWPVELFVFRAASFEQVVPQLQLLLRFLRESDAPLRLRDLAYSVAQADGPVQCSIVASDRQDLAYKLECAQVREKQAGVYYREPASEIETGKLAFVFPGQGSQSPGMLQELFVAFPLLHDILTAGASWCELLFPPPAHNPEETARQQRQLTDTRVAQPALGMADTAMARLLHACGLQPDMLAGHSYGELVALAQAGCFDLDTLLHLSSKRGQVILAATGDDPGRMAAVSAGYTELAALFPAGSGVVLANQNSPTQTVISGSTTAINAALIRLKERGIAARAIDVACAFHSPLVAAAEANFAGILDACDLALPQRAVYSNVTTQPYPQDKVAIKTQLAAQIVNPVRFVEQIEQMYADGARIFVEVGPARVLTGLIQSILGKRPHQVIGTDQKAQSGLANLLTALAQLAVLRPEMHFSALWAGREAQALDLTQPHKLPATCWLINGARARPRQGELPAHAGRVLTAPLNLQTMATASVSHASRFDALPPADQAVLSYLNNMRDLVTAQRDVMLNLLQAPPAAALPGAATSPSVARLTTTATAGLNSPQAALSANSPAADTHSATPTDLTQLKNVLLSIVADRTGYPAEMLDPELDLEADLSIDSIKRVEIMGELASRIGLRERLGSNADRLLEELAQQKTLHAVLNWLEAHVALAPSAVSEGAGQTKGRESSTLSPEPVTAALLDPQKLLLHIVSQRTGYPEEVLDIDLDLEADLSIDSIKRLEIVAELTEQLGLQSRGGEGGAAASAGNGANGALEQLSALKTLRAMINWLQPAVAQNAVVKEVQAGSSPSTAASDHRAAKTGKAAVQPVDEASTALIPLQRYVLRCTPAAPLGKLSIDLTGKHFLITDDGLGVAAQLVERLARRGAKAQVISFVEQASLPQDLEGFDGLIHLFGLNAAARVRDVKRSFKLVRDLLLLRTTHLMIVSGLGGHFGQVGEAEKSLPNDFGYGAGMAGMLKSLIKERPDVRAQYLDLELTAAPEQLAAYLEAELTTGQPLTEVSYFSGQRLQLVAQAAPLTAALAKENLPLDKDSVILLTGGARGITAQLAVALARRYGCQLELVGRSPLPLTPEDSYTQAATDRKALRQLLIRQQPGLKPAEIEQRCSYLLAAREIRRTFQQIEAAGGRVGYTALDVRDIDAFAAHIEALYQRHGRIDGVIHGAGVIEDKLLPQKTAESFQRVFDTKVRGALMLYKHLRDDVRFVVFFSSVASAFGNRGQIDYASANDVLDKIAHALRSRFQGRILSVNWGPWAGTGMVSAELEREYARQGIGLIPLDDGIDALLRELQYGSRTDSQVVFMCATPQSMGVA